LSLERRQREVNRVRRIASFYTYRRGSRDFIRIERPAIQPINLATASHIEHFDPEQSIFASAFFENAFNYLEFAPVVEAGRLASISLVDRIPPAQRSGMD
jgi:hypothetical protein